MEPNGNDQPGLDRPISKGRSTTENRRLGSAIGIGIAIGAALGIALDNLALGVGLGSAIGVAIGAGTGGLRKDEGGVTPED